MAYTPQLNPQPLGNVVVSTPGVPVQITLALQSTPVGSGNLVQSPTDTVPCNKFSVIASPITHANVGNTGKVYIGSASMVRSTLAGVIGVVYPGGSFTATNNVSMNIYDANKIFIDADTAGDGIYGSIDTV